MFDKVKGMERKLLEALRVSCSPLQQDIAALRNVTRNVTNEERGKTIRSWGVEHQDHIAELNEKFSEAARERTEEEIQMLMLHSLYFPQMEERYERVAVAHSQTFNWIFESHNDPSVPWAKFVPWLENRDDQTSLYWVTGNAGSGKSTLMKYIRDDPRSRAHLQYWSHPFEPTFASCFFWNPGTQIQKSLVGLLQSLIYGIFEQHQRLIKVASAWRWQSYELGVSRLSSWTEMELLNVLQTIIAESHDSAKYFFLIDGLDEFEGNDTSRTRVIDLFKGISRHLHVKVCLSSRPWPIYEDAFEDSPSLLLQHLTYEDIKKYVHIELGGNSRFRKLKSRDKEGCSKLVLSIVDKAVGVFLWIFLVVKSLLEGLRNEDDLDDLKRRLDLIPAELEDYFAQIIGTLDAFYLEQATRLFQIALNAGSLSLLTYSYTQERDPDFAFKAKIEEISPQDVDERHASMKRRLNSRCKGLLEIHAVFGCDHPFFEYEVDFLHRTVRDFMKFTALNSILQPYVDSSFDADTEVCKSYICQLKFLRNYFEEEINFSTSLMSTEPSSLLKGFLLFARAYEQKHKMSPRRVMDELDTVMTALWRQASERLQLNVQSLGHWSNQKLSPDDSPSPHQRLSFLRFGLLVDLPQYVMERIKEDRTLVASVRGQLLLDDARGLSFQEARRMQLIFTGLFVRTPEQYPEVAGLINEYM